jgi:hypothetical protein
MSLNGDRSLNMWVRTTILTGGVALLAYLASGAASDVNKRIDRSHELAVKAISKSSEQSTQIAVIESKQDEFKDNQRELKKDVHEMSQKIDRLMELQLQTLSAAKRLENR